MELAVAAAVPPLVLWAAGRSRRRVAEQWAKLGDFQALNDHQAGSVKGDHGEAKRPWSPARRPLEELEGLDVCLG